MDCIRGVFQVNDLLSADAMAVNRDFQATCKDERKNEHLVLPSNFFIFRSFVINTLQATITVVFSILADVVQMVIGVRMNAISSEKKKITRHYTMMLLKEFGLLKILEKGDH